ncbi:MAG TPA: hypothetical protein VJ895_00955 [Candidatus Nanoarchaeia archaeon]|nr:hypothetical protein [Candidatus Nanoarchaeia archaeon]
MGYIKDLQEVIKLHEFQIELSKEFSRKKHMENFSKEIGENKEYYSKRFKNKAEEYTILQLWTIFERYLFELTNHYIQMNSDQNTLSKVIREKIIEKIERWPLGEILDLYKTIIDSHTVGMIKQIKKYRDWLVHKNTNKGSPGKIGYEDAYIYLSDFLNFLYKSNRTRRGAPLPPRSIPPTGGMLKKSNTHPWVFTDYTRRETITFFPNHQSKNDIIKA